MLKEKQILAVIKEPGKDPRVEICFENTLESFQTAVGGYIEVLPIFADLTLICNEEGKLRNLPYNVTICNYDLVGTVIAVGTKGEDFCSIKGYNVPFVINLLRGDR